MKIKVRFGRELEGPQTAELTTEHSQSSYGLPVIVLSDGSVIAPATLVEGFPARDLAQLILDETMRYPSLDGVAVEDLLEIHDPYIEERRAIETEYQNLVTAFRG